MIDYVVGFMFNIIAKRVVLIRKEKPSWQKGYLNGVGGKVEIGEASIEAMEREFNEEAGLLVSAWRPVGVMANHEARVSVFAVQSTRITEVKSMTNEHIEIHSVENIFTIRCMPNLRWLIPLSINVLTRNAQTPDKSMYFTCDT